MARGSLLNLWGISDPRSSEPPDPSESSTSELSDPSSQTADTSRESGLDPRPSAEDYSDINGPNSVQTTFKRSSGQHCDLVETVAEPRSRDGPALGSSLQTTKIHPFFSRQGSQKPEKTTASAHNHDDPSSNVRSRPTKPKHGPSKPVQAPSKPSYLVKLTISPDKYKEMNQAKHSVVASQKSQSKPSKNNSNDFFRQSLVVKLPVTHEWLEKLSSSQSTPAPTETPETTSPPDNLSQSTLPDIASSEVPKSRSNTEEHVAKASASSSKKTVTHSFFAKRQPSRAPVVPIPASEKAKPLGHAPFPIEHVRGERDTTPVSVLTKRRHRKLPSKLVWLGDLPGFSINLDKPPDRLLFKSDDVKNMAATFAPTFETLLSRVGSKSALDKGMFESQMWTEKYSPESPQECMCTETSARIASWIATKTRQLQSAPPAKRRKTALDGFIVDDSFDDGPESEDALPNILLITGKSGVGKTAAVYAAAAESNGFVFEVNSSSRRAGRDLASVIDGIGQSHSVHSRRNCIVLIEDVDIIFENEAGSFWQQLEKLAATSRRPLVVTCEDAGRLCLNRDDYDLIAFEKPDLVRLTQLCLLIALAEGYILDPRQVANCAVGCDGDIRKSITELQLWCQVLATRPSGVDWYPKEHEMQSADRIISKGMALPPYCQKQSLDDENDNSLTLLCLDADTTSSLDVLHSTIVDRSRPEETVSGYQPLTQICEQVTDRILSAQICMLRTQKLPNQSPVFSRNLRNTFADASFVPLDILACDIAPYARTMALADRHRLEILSQHAEGGARMTRRAWQSAGLDGRQHFYGDHEEILRTSYWTIAKPQAAAISPL